MSEELKTLNQAIADLHHTTKRLNSFKMVFVRGIIGGIGTFLGATIIAAVAITILVQVLKLFSIDLGLSEYLESLLRR